ncbi:MAG TPA: preprotein translocase subunit SecE [Candidatus Dormibacteraeota bacterium]|nr:preprotein translocase subunit SecE [Candidatus Dormibacteraeota bacterium]
MANVAREERPDPSEGSYLREVWSELRKTVWPTWPELRQMTGVVIVTVVLLGAFLGVLDFGLTSLLKPLYTAPAGIATPTPTATVSPTPTATATPTATPSTSATP